MTDDAPGARDRARETLATLSDEHGIVRRLHAVPPHAVYEVTVDGRRAVCKVATGPRGAPATEAAVLRYVGRETAVPVPTALASGDDHFVAEWAPDIDDEFDEATARIAGAAMARLHRDSTGDFGAPGRVAADGDELAVAEREDWARVIEERLLDRREYLATVGHADVADAVLAAVRDRPDAAADPDDPVLCHGNVLPGHVGAVDGEVTALIDFEHAVVGPPEYDLWRSIVPLSSNADADADLAGAVRAGYESVRPLPGGLDECGPLYGALLAVEYLKSLYLQDQHAPDETEARAERLRDAAFDRLDDLA